MKKLLLLTLILPFAFSCKKEEKSEADFQKELIEYRKKLITFDIGEKPKNFSAKTLSGTTFNLKDHLGKTIVIFGYNEDYLQASEYYDMVKEIQNVYDKTKGKAEFIGILDDLVDDEKALHQKMKAANLPFDQIDNSRNPNKSKQVLLSMGCLPARYVIDKTGKVVIAVCGGHGEENLIPIIDSLAQK